MVTVKAHEKVPMWGMAFIIPVSFKDVFATNVDAFPDLFRRVLAMTSITTFSFVARRLLLGFVIRAFQSLDVPFLKKELAPLAQVSIWHGLSSEGRRNQEFENHPPLRKIWKGSQKRFDAGGINCPVTRF